MLTPHRTRRLFAVIAIVVAVFVSVIARIPTVSAPMEVARA